MCSGSEAGSYSRLIDVVCHSTLGLRVIKREVADPREALHDKHGSCAQRHDRLRHPHVVPPALNPFRGLGFGFRISDFGFRISGVGCKVYDLVLRV